MSNEFDSKHARINDKIAASQARLMRDGPDGPHRKLLPDEYPPEHISTLAGQYPMLTLVAGAVAGVALGALLPRAFGRKFSRRAFTILTVAGELGLAASQRARVAAELAGRQGTTRLSEVGENFSESSAGLRRRAGQVAGSAAGGVRSVGLTLANEAMKLATRARR